MSYVSSPPRKKRKRSRSTQGGGNTILSRSNSPVVPRTTRSQTSPGQPIPKSTAEYLSEISERIEDREPDFCVESRNAPQEDVCWKWALYGAKATDAADINWAYNYVFPAVIQGCDISAPVPPSTAPEVKKKLDEARELVKKRGIPKNDMGKAHQITLAGLCMAAGLTPVDQGPLTMKVYWDDKSGEFMYRHLELEYDDKICIKKFNGGQVVATPGRSLLEPGAPGQKVLSTSIHVDVNSLSEDHRTYLAQIHHNLPKPSERTGEGD